MIAVIFLFAKRKVLLTFAVVLFSWFVYGQTNDAVRKQSEFSHRTSTGLSQLAEENLSRVAASAVQIREVLIRDVGLQVELKRWVAPRDRTRSAWSPKRGIPICPYLAV